MEPHNYLIIVATYVDTSLLEIEMMQSIRIERLFDISSHEWLHHLPTNHFKFREYGANHLADYEAML